MSFESLSESLNKKTPLSLFELYLKRYILEKEQVPGNTSQGNSAENLPKDDILNNSKDNSGQAELPPPSANTEIKLANLAKLALLVNIEDVKKIINSKKINANNKNRSDLSKFNTEINKLRKEPDVNISELPSNLSDLLQIIQTAGLEIQNPISSEEITKLNPNVSKEWIEIVKAALETTDDPSNVDSYSSVSNFSGAKDELNKLFEDLNMAQQSNDSVNSYKITTQIKNKLKELLKSNYSV